MCYWIISYQSDVCVRFNGENEILIKKIIFLNEHSALATKDYITSNEYIHKDALSLAILVGSLWPGCMYIFM